jgi:HK97 family phage major capsid protein
MGMSARPPERFSPLRLFRSRVPGATERADYEDKCSAEEAKRLGITPQGFLIPENVQRELTVASPAGGGYLVGTDNAPAGTFIAGLRPRSLREAFGVITLDGLRGNITVPRLDAGAAVGWQSSESAPITESQPTFGQLPASPKTVGALVDLTRLFYLQISPAVDAWLISELKSALNAEIDRALIGGSGASGQPRGLLLSGIGSQAGASLDWAGITAMMASVESADAVRTPFNTGWAGAPDVAEILRTRLVGDRPSWDGDTIAGRPAVSSNSVPAGTLVFGDWSQVVLAQWSGLDVAVSESHNSNFQTGLQTVRALSCIDVLVLVPQAFCAATSVT